MTSKKIKAIFYAYSSNALDNLLPYAVLCRKKKIPCTFILGQDFLTHKVSVKKNFIKIFSDYNIKTYCSEIVSFKKKGFLQFIFIKTWKFTNTLADIKFVPRFIKKYLEILSRELLKIMDNELIGKNMALKFLDDNEETLIFIDTWKRMEILNGFLSEAKGRASIIAVGHGPPHFTWKEKQIIKQYPSSLSEDIFLASNRIHFDDKLEGYRIVTGNLRYSQKWSSILNEYNEQKNFNNTSKKKILILGTQKEHTGDWEAMLRVLEKLKMKKDISLRFMPHIRGMSSIKPPKILKDIWDPKISLFDAVQNSDIVLFWRSSAFFQAVLMNKRVLFLSFVAPKNINFMWQENASSRIIINNEKQLFEALENYSKNDYEDYNCFNEVICPEGDPWKNVSNFLDNFLFKN